MSLAQFLMIGILAAVVIAAIMSAAWAIQRRTENSGWIDTCWSFGTGGAAVIIALIPLASTPWHWRQIVVAGLVAAWSLRLGLHIAYRSQAVGDDPRYRALIEQWGADAPHRLFWFLQAQAGVGTVLALSVALAAHNAEPALRIQDMLGIAILALAFVGEALADRQLRAFRADPANQANVCDTGLWRLSRHPNYFFEWLSWTAYPLIAVDLSGSNPLGWLAVAAPICMYWVLVHVSGIPPLEKHMLASRGESFRSYQRRTSKFFPIPPND